MRVAGPAASGVTLVTRYASLKRWQALLVMAGLACLGVWFQLGAASPKSLGYVPTTPGPVMSDDDLYIAIIDRVRRGEDYYDAAAHELRTRGYPIKPAFNFRQPTYAWFLSRLPSLAWGNWIQALLAAFAVVLGHKWLRRTAGPRVAWRGAALLAMAFLGVRIANYPLFQETWAGLFVFLSLALMALGRWQWGMVAAFAALSFREFGLLACAVGLVLALRNRRWPEAALWVAGIATYAVLMHFHLSAAGQYGLPEDRPRSWVGFGGSAFVVLSMQFTPLLGALPRWLVALLVPLALLGLAGWKDRGGTHLALVCFGYVAAFSVIGLTCNNYWGPLYAPLIYLGLAFAPESLRDLWRAARTGSFAINHQPFNVVTAERM